MGANLNEFLLLYLAEPIYGGWVTATHNIRLALPGSRIVKVGSKTEAKTREFYLSSSYQNLSKEHLSKMVDKYDGRVIVTALDKHNFEDAKEILDGKKFILFVHDPAELKDGLIEVAKQHNCKLITNGKLNAQSIAKKIDKEVTQLNLPYNLRYRSTQIKTKNAVSCCRIDWDKRTHIIVDCVEKFGVEVDLFGACNNQYAFMKCKPKEVFDRIYKGGFKKTEEPLSISLPYRKLVDLSVISGDGGRVQYSFLEAFDSECQLIVHKDWLTEADQTIKEGYNCLAVGSPEELKEALLSPVDQKMIENGRATLKEHSLNQFKLKVLALFGERTDSI